MLRTLSPVSNQLHRIHPHKNVLAQFSTVIIMVIMVNNPDWIFYRHEGAVEADVMPRLVEEFPGFRPRWEKHIKYWDGKPAGYYNDIAEFAHFVGGELYPNGKTEEVQHAFDLMEYWLNNGNKTVQELVVIGFLEDLQNLAVGREAFVPFLGPKSREAWIELDRFWDGKSSVR